MIKIRQARHPKIRYFLIDKPKSRGRSFSGRGESRSEVHKVNDKGKILDIGGVSDVAVDPSLGVAVVKAGRSTALTFGTISAVGVTALVSYSRGTARSVEQFLITPGEFSAPGDSGSSVVTDEKMCLRPVGLLFAGSSAMTLANPIKAVYEKLKVEPVSCCAEAIAQGI